MGVSVLAVRGDRLLVGDAQDGPRAQGRIHVGETGEWSQPMLVQSVLARGYWERPPKGTQVPDGYDPPPAPAPRQGVFDPDQLRDERGRWATDPSSANTEAAQEIVEKVAVAEPAVTADMTRISAALGGEMLGLDFRLKSVESLSRKIDDKMREGMTRAQAGASVKDALRYTMSFETGDYTENVVAALDELQQSGYRIEEIKNYWEPGDPYSGINAVVGFFDMKMEVQFHTPESFATKMAAHEEYQEYRAADSTPEERARLYSAMAEDWETVPIPPEVDVIGTPVWSAT